MTESNSLLETPTIVLASGNRKKAAEMRSLLPEHFRVLTASDVELTLPPETGDSFEENAILKAEAAARQTGLLAVADDSGIVVDALDGMPGVRSARFAADHGRAESDDENNRLLLEKLADVPMEQRTARFVAAVVIVDTDGSRQICHGSVEGIVGSEPRGSNGFGYDVVFIPNGFDRTMAELDPDTKNAISHRGQAFRDAVAIIRERARRTSTAR